MIKSQVMEEPMRNCPMLFACKTFSILSGLLLFFAPMRMAHAGAVPTLLEEFDSTTECPSGMVGYWTLDDGTAKDTVGANDGTIVGATPTTGIVGQALSFDGTPSHEYVNIGNRSNFPVGNQPFTLEAWVKPTDASNAINWQAISLYGQLACNAGAGLVIPPGTAKVALTWHCGTGRTDSVTIMENGTWYHAVGTYDGSFVKIYVNGEMENSIYYPDSYLVNNFAYISDSGELSSDREFYGVIDEVAIYNRALTNNEIRDHYQRGLAGHGYCGQPSVPTPPSDLHAQGISDQKSLLRWSDTSDNETGFAVERKSGACESTDPWQEIATTPPETTVFVDQGLTANTRYSYRLRAFNDHGSSDFTECVSAKTRKINYPKPPKKKFLEAERGTGDGSVMQRSRARGHQTVWLHENETRTMNFQLPFSGCYKLYVRYSNDNDDTLPNEVISVSVEGVFLGNFRAEDTPGPNPGDGWNVFRVSDNIGFTVLPRGRHSVTVNVAGGDGYGVEIDNIKMELEY